jgi:hypothetical protein
MQTFSAPPALAEGVARVTGRRPAAWSALVGAGGYTPAHRLIVRFADGGTAFVKAATGESTAGFIRNELPLYERLRGDFLPAYLGGEAGNDADPESTFLVLEDLSGAHWPPPWTPARVDAVLESLAGVRAAAPLASPGLPLLPDLMDDFASWHRIATAPERFLSLGLCSRAWLDSVLPTLIAAEAATPLTGTDLLHLDVRSDNLCFRPDGSAVLVDWNWACVGNGTLDITGWLPSLHAEGGPRPDVLMPDGAGPYAALLSGYWAFRAGQPPPPGAPRVRQVQRRQLDIALPWAIRALGLPPLDGPSAP